MRKRSTCFLQLAPAGNERAVGFQCHVWLHEQLHRISTGKRPDSTSHFNLLRTHLDFQRMLCGFINKCNMLLATVRLLVVLIPVKPSNLECRRYRVHRGWYRFNFLSRRFYLLNRRLKPKFSFDEACTNLRLWRKSNSRLKVSAAWSTDQRANPVQAVKTGLARSG